MSVSQSSQPNYAAIVKPRIFQPIRKAVKSPGYFGPIVKALKPDMMDKCIDVLGIIEVS